MKPSGPLRRKSAMKRSAAPLRSTPLPRRALAGDRPSPKAKKRKADPVTKATRDEVHARSGGHCEARHSPKCSGKGQHLHHRLHRRHGDHSAANLLDVCVVCHDAIHGRKRDASGATVYDLGLIVRSTQAPRKKAA